MYDETYNESIEDGEFEEIPDREVILTKDLSDEDMQKIAESEMAEVSPEDAAVFAKELEEAQTELDAATNTDRPLTQREMVTAINTAVASGKLSRSRKERMMREMGIFKSTFTKKVSAKPAKMKKRKAAKKARRKNRK